MLEGPNSKEYKVKSRESLLGKISKNRKKIGETGTIFYRFFKELDAYIAPPLNPSPIYLLHGGCDSFLLEHDTEPKLRHQWCLVYRAKPTDSHLSSGILLLISIVVSIERSYENTHFNDPSVISEILKVVSLQQNQIPIILFRPSH